MDDRTTLASMSLVELNKGLPEEIAGIMACAWNRWQRTKKRYPDKTLYDLIDNKCGGAFTGGTPSSHMVYMTRMGRFSTSPLIEDRLILADMVIGAELGTTLVGLSENFVHPSSKAFDSPSPKRPILDKETGRYLPLWSIAKEHGGAAKYPPMTIGITRFS